MDEKLLLHHPKFLANIPCTLYVPSGHADDEMYMQGHRCVCIKLHRTNTHFKSVLPKQSQKKGGVGDLCVEADTSPSSKISPNTLNLTPFHSALISRNTVLKIQPPSFRERETPSVLIYQNISMLPHIEMGTFLFP